VSDLLLSRDGKLDNLNILNKADVDSGLLVLPKSERARNVSETALEVKLDFCERFAVQSLGGMETNDVGLEDGENGLLGDELGKLDVSLVVVLIFLLLVILIVGILLELGVLHEDR
jgi:hypothetical protein